jgi:hypothetical protein
MESSEVLEAIFKNQHRQDEAKHQRELDLIKKGVVVDLVSPMEQAISTLVTMRNNGLKKADDAELQDVITLLTGSVAQGPSGLWAPKLFGDPSGAGGATEQHSETQKWLMSEVHGPAHADNSVAKDAGNSKRVTRIYRRGQDKDASLGVQVLAAGRYLRDEKGAPGGTAVMAPALKPALLQMLRTIATHTPEPEAPLVQPWSFDVFKLAEVTGNAPLQFMGPALFVRHGFISRFDLNEAKLAPFFAALGEGYDAPGNSYHNSSHATSVAGECFALPHALRRPAARLPLEHATLTPRCRCSCHCSGLQLFPDGGWHPKAPRGVADTGFAFCCDHTRLRPSGH